MFVSGVLRVERRCPFFHSGNDVRTVAFTQLDLRQLTRLVFRFLQQLQQRGNRRAVYPGSFRQRPPLIRDSINAAVVVVAIGIAQMMLHVADDRILPVRKINRAIWSHIDRHGTEIRIAGTDEVLQSFAF